MWSSRQRLCIGLAFVAAALSSTALASRAHAQCTGQWLPGTGVPGISGQVNAAVMWDPDGAGPQPAVLVVGGAFTLADSTLVNNIASWNGSSWSAMGAGLGATTGVTGTSQVNALVVYNGDLIAGGTFTNSGATALGGIARWNSATSTWSPINSGSTIDFGAGGVNALVSAPNGDLIAGGTFTLAGTNTSGTVPVNFIARWDGTAWGAVNPSGTAFGVGGTGANVNALAIASNGDLLGGGAFTTAGTAGSGSFTTNRIARWVWNGTDWAVQSLSTGFSAGAVNSITPRASGDIIVTGTFSTFSRGLARWDSASSTFVAVGTTTFDQTPNVATVLPSGDIIAGGGMNTSGSIIVNRLTRFDSVGSGGWSAFWTDSEPLRTITCLTVLPNGDLLVGGTFKTAGGVPANGVATWDGSAWHGLTSGQTSTSNPITALQTLPNGSVAAGGSFRTIEGVAAQRIATIGATGVGAWSPAGPGLYQATNPYTALHTWNSPVCQFATLPSGDLVAVGMMDLALTPGGSTSSVSRFDGAAWNGYSPSLTSQLLVGLQFSYVSGAAVMPNGDLIVAGRFFLPGDTTNMRYMARWNGTTWVNMGLNAGNDFRFLVKPNGHLILYGNVTNIGGTTGLNYIAEWDGSSLNGSGFPVWTALPSGPTGAVRSVVIMPNGDLVAGGVFTTVGASPNVVTVNRVARWNGSAWSALGSGMSGTVCALAVMPNGDLVASGQFTAAVGATPACNLIARWNGSAWSPMGSGLGTAGGNATGSTGGAGQVLALAVTPSGVLLAGGEFATAGGQVSAYIARWADCVGVCCQADGSCTAAATGSPSATCATGTLVAGGTCSPNTCPPPAAGVCCRGATCSATVTQANCTAAAPIGAVYVTTSPTCNSGGSATTPC